MKKWVMLILLMTIMLTSCKEATNEDVYLKLQKKLGNIKSYTCMAYVEAKGNKSAKTYVFKHYYKYPDYYKLEVMSPESLKGLITVYDKNKITISNPRLRDEYKMAYKGEENKYLFVGDFLKNIVENEDVKIYSSNKHIVLETTIPGLSVNFSKEKLFVDKKTLEPFMMKIIDDNGKPRFTITYKNFKYNGD